LENSPSNVAAADRVPAVEKRRRRLAASFVHCTVYECGVMACSSPSNHRGGNQRSQDDSQSRPRHSAHNSRCRDPGFVHRTRRMAQQPCRSRRPQARQRCLPRQPRGQRRQQLDSGRSRGEQPAGRAGANQLPYALKPAVGRFAPARSRFPARRHAARTSRRKVASCTRRSWLRRQFFLNSFVLLRC